MKALKLVSILFVLNVFVGCSSSDTLKSITVTNNQELLDAITAVEPGTEIILEDGVYSDIEIQIQAEATENAPILVKAKNPGKVFIEGVSNLKLAGSYITVEGLYFRNGYSPSKNVIAFRIDEENVANHCRVTNTVILDFNQLQRDSDDLWVQFYGKHNQLDHCYLAGKTNGGPTVRVDLKGNQSIRNYHKIVNNHFGPRPRKGGARGETIQLGSSFTSMSPSNTLIANNLFEACNGEVEIISSKTNFNIIKNNVFYKSEGSVVTRHGNYVTVDGNYFIGDGVNENYGGIRIINTGHWVINNYFYGIVGKNFRSPIAIMNGIPKSPLNRYNQVTDVVVAYNSFIDCKSPWQFGVGTNISQKDVLPKSEIRSARPLRTEVANNIIYNSVGDASPIIEHDKADGVKFKSNVINNQGVGFENEDRFTVSNFELKNIAGSIFTTTGLPAEVTPYVGFEFETIENDLFNESRANSTAVGAIVNPNAQDPAILDKTKYGADWYSNVKEATTAQTFEVATTEALVSKLAEAKAGDIIALAAGTYNVSESVVINKSITIQSKDAEKAELVFNGAENTALFELNPYGILSINNVKLVGNGSNNAFASLKENMFNHFGLTTDGIEVSNFNFVLKAYKQSFAEEITFKNSSFSNCANGIELSEETNDRGDYNTEFLTVDNCKFDNVASNVIDYYRGGYDESTIGGNLLLTNSSFKNCGAKEPTKILINTRGIVNVAINGNSFENNRTKLVALLWGAKNNSEKDNTVKNSGIIKTEENLKQKLMY